MEGKGIKRVSHDRVVNLGPNQLRSLRWEYPKLCRKMAFFKKPLQLQLHSLIITALDADFQNFLKSSNRSSYFVSFLDKYSLRKWNQNKIDRHFLVPACIECFLLSILFLFNYIRIYFSIVSPYNTLYLHTHTTN